MKIKDISLKEGIYKDPKSDRYIFNWNKDIPTDILYLDLDTSGVSKVEGIDYIYGYEFNPKSDREAIKNFRTNLKHSLDNEDIFFSEDIEDFVEDGILHADAHKSLNLFTVLVTIKSSTVGNSGNSLLNLIKPYIYEYTDNARFSMSIELIKKLCEEVKFDVDKVRTALHKSRKYKDLSNEEIEDIIENTVKLFDKCKEKGEIFKIKRYLPLPVRSGFSDFLDFKDERDRKLYQELDKGTEVLICEDFVTSGNTIREVKRLLESVNPNNRLTVFALINQLREV